MKQCNGIKIIQGNYSQIKKKGLCDLTKDETKYGEYSKEWYKQNLPKGVTVNEQLTKSALPGIVCMDIDIVEYPSLLSQMGIINYIELAFGTYELEYHYSIMDKSQNVFQYMSAREFREEWGYDNKFFEGGEIQMGDKDNRILKKIQNKEYDEEVKEFINEAMQWYQDHSRELLTD